MQGETHIPLLDNSAIADASVVKVRFRPRVRETPTEKLFELLDTLGLNDADSADVGDILWRRLDITVWDAGRKENETALDLNETLKDCSLLDLRHVSKVNLDINIIDGFTDLERATTLLVYF